MSDAIIKWLREAIAAGPTPGHMECIDRTVFVLMHAGWRKGEELFKNRITLTVNHDHAECHVDEARATARFIAAASPDNITALLDRLDKAERENERLRAENGDCNSALTRLGDEMRGLRDKYQAVRAENEKLRRSQSRRVGYVCEQCGWTLSAEPAERDAADR